MAGLWRAAGACAVILFSVGAHAQDNLRREWLKWQFGGWSGLSFYCEAGKTPTKTAESLCMWATQRVRMLARQSGVPLIVTSSDPLERALERQKGSGAPLDLVLYITTTTPQPGDVIAVFAAVRAAPDVRLPPDAKTKAEGARSGALVMWEAHTIASGIPGHELDGALQQAVETNLMKFLNDYLDGAR